MNREELKALLASQGVLPENIDVLVNAIMAQYGQATGDLNSELTSITEQRDNLQAQVDTVTGQLATLREDAEAAPELRQRIETMETSNNESMLAMKKDYEIRIALRDAKAKNAKAVEGLLDKSIIKVDSEGNVVGLKEQLESLKNAEDSSFLFHQEQTNEPPKPNITFNQNSNVDNNTLNEKDPFEKILEEINNGGY